MAVVVMVAAGRVVASSEDISLLKVGEETPIAETIIGRIEKENTK